MCWIKEPNFHCQDLDMPGPKTEAEYLGLFEPTSATRLLADASILSLYSREAPTCIAAYVEDPRIVMMLRNPVEAMYAWHGQMVFTANEPLHEFSDALAAESDRKEGRRIPRSGTSSRCPQLLYYREIMRYADQLQRYRDTFPPKSIHVALYDDFKADPLAVYAQILGFLDLDPFVPELKVVNPPKVRRNWQLHYWLKKLFAAPARALLPAKLRLRLIVRLDQANSRPEKRQPLDPQLEQRLKLECRPDVLRLGQMLDRDLSHWCQ